MEKRTALKRASALGREVAKIKGYENWRDPLEAGYYQAMCDMGVDMEIILLKASIKDPAVENTPLYKTIKKYLDELVED
jgi:hypothetical protein